MHKSSLISTLVLTLALLLSMSLNAEQKGGSYTFKLTGKLVKITWCKVNNDQPVNVSFGNVGIKKVASGQYIQDIDYSLVCNNVTDAATVEMTLKATAQSWDNMAMATDIGDLGVRVIKDGQPMKFNEPISISPGVTPKLQAQLVQKTGATLPESTFKATGTLVVDYK